jgi:hypothetical protein
LIKKLDHPPYLPDFAMCYILLFAKLKTTVESLRFSDIIDVQDYAMTILKNVSEGGLPPFFCAVETHTDCMYCCTRRHGR